MPLSDAAVVDAMGMDMASGEVVLSLVDEMDWVDPGGHSDLLGEKLNHYLGFVQAGELLVMYPESEGHATRIDIIFLWEPPNELAASLAGAADLAASCGCSITWRIYED
jgi:hypothetical protein